MDVPCYGVSSYTFSTLVTTTGVVECGTARALQFMQDLKLNDCETLLDFANGSLYIRHIRPKEIQQSDKSPCSTADIMQAISTFESPNDVHNEPLPMDMDYDDGNDEPTPLSHTQPKIPQPQPKAKPVDELVVALPLPGSLRPKRS